GLPTSTRQYRIGFLNSVSSSTLSTRPTTRSPVTAARRSSIASTSRPTRTRARSSSSAASSGRSTYSRSQDRETRISSLDSFLGSARLALHTEGAAEADVALDHVAHVG